MSGAGDIDNSDIVGEEMLDQAGEEEMTQVGDSKLDFDVWKTTRLELRCCHHASAGKDERLSPDIQHERFTSCIRRRWVQKFA